MAASRQQTLLSIAIPTYNRATYLDLCLSQLCEQTDRIGKDIELIVSDNASPDATTQIVEKYCDSDVPIKYVRNMENIGADANILQCYKLATGKYVLLLADDDLIVDGALDTILLGLESGDFGIVHLKSYSFVSDFRSEARPSDVRNKMTVYSDKEQFIRKVNIMLTFISGNIINKTLVNSDLDFESFCATNLVQMSWTLSAFMNSSSNLFINQPCIAAKAENTGGYSLCRVFGVNLRSILLIFEKMGFPSGLSRHITNFALCDFLPGYILKLRKNSKGFHAEDFFGTLSPVYSSVFLFWLVTVPAIRLPLPLAKIWNKIVKKCLKIGSKFRG